LENYFLIYNIFFILMNTLMNQSLKKFHLILKEENLLLKNLKIMKKIIYLY